MTRNPVLFRNFIIFSSVVGLCVVGLAYHTYSSRQEIAKSNYWVDHTQKIIMEVQDFYTITTGLISEQRNLVINKNADSGSYEKEKANISNQIAMLRDLVKDNAVQTSRMTEIEHLTFRLKDLLDEKIAEYKDSIQAPGLSDYDAIVSTRDDSFRLIGEVMKEEYRLLGLREKRLSQMISNYQMSLFIGGVFSALVILVFNWYLLNTQAKYLRTEASLKESEERMRLAVRGSNDGIFDWDFKTKKIFWSAQFKRMLGYEENEIEGSEEVFKSLLHPEDSDTYWQNFNNYINGSLSEFSSIFRMNHKSGRPVWIHARGKAIFDESGMPLRFIGAHTDISYIKEHERQIKEERDRAEAASQAKGDFLAHMSHEIRTPLTAISGIAEILNKEPAAFDEKSFRLIKTLKTSTETLKELITDILDFSKIESGEVELHKQKFPLGEMFEQVVSMMSVKALEKDLTFTFDYSDLKNTIFYGDKQRMRQILINLTGNAIKFTEKGSVTVTAKIEPAAESHILKIDVTDTGIGIPESAIGVIFEKFRQADSTVSRRYGGTGLGLPISKNLAEIMGGVIKADSKPGAGSTFSFILPFTSVQSGEQDVDMDEVIKVQKLNDRLRAAIGGEKKILLVEDYEGNIVVLSYLLNSLECRYDIAKTGLEALQRWKENHYDLILMDVQMPEMDGLTATRTIRKMEEEQAIEKTPIIGLTAHALVADKDKCIEAGMDAYLSKPIVEADLKTTILEMLEKQPGDKSRAA